MVKHVIAVNNSGTMVKHMGTIVGSEKLKPGQPGFMVNIFVEFYRVDYFLFIQHKYDYIYIVPTIYPPDISQLLIIYIYIYIYISIYIYIYIYILFIVFF